MFIFSNVTDVFHIKFSESRIQKKKPIECICSTNYPLQDTLILMCLKGASFGMRLCLFWIAFIFWSDEDNEAKLV